MTQPAISVIIPTRDRHDSLAAVLDHLYRTGPIAEVIIIDDGSAIPVRFDPPIQVIRFDRSRGHAAGRNTGATRASSDILVFLDDDIFPQEEAWSYLLGHLTEAKHVWAAPRFTDTLAARPAPDATVIPQPHLPAAMLVTRRETFNALGGFDETLTRMVDFDLTYRANSAGHRLLLDMRALAEHRDRIHTFPEKVQRLHEWLRIFPRIWEKQQRPVQMLREVGNEFYFPSAFPRKRSLQRLAHLLQPDWAWERFRRCLPHQEPKQPFGRTFYAIGGARGALRGFRELSPDAQTALRREAKHHSVR